MNLSKSHKELRREGFEAFSPMRPNEDGYTVSKVLYPDVIYREKGIEVFDHSKQPLSLIQRFAFVRGMNIARWLYLRKLLSKKELKKALLETLAQFGVEIDPEFKNNLWMRTAKEKVKFIVDFNK